MIIQCHQCKALVDAEEIGHLEYEEAFWFERIYLLQCPVCKLPLVGKCDDISGTKGQEWSQLVRVYPNPERAASLSEFSGLPKVVIDSLKEAEKCVQVGAHLAATAMAGRAVEGICRHFSTKGSYLGNGLKELKDRGLIDSRLYEWGEALRDERNRASHAEDTTFSARDAEYILTFTYAIVDYVFLLAKKFEAFQERKIMAEQEKKNEKSRQAASSDG